MPSISQKLLTWPFVLGGDHSARGPSLEGTDSCCHPCTGATAAASTDGICTSCTALHPSPCPLPPLQQSRAVSSAWLPCVNVPFMEQSRLGEDSSQLLWLPGHLTGAGCWSQLPALSPAARGAHRAAAHPLQCCFSASPHHKTFVPVASRRL